MTGYLSAVSARELAPPSASGTDHPDAQRSGIEPRRASPFEPWSIPATLSPEADDQDEAGATEMESANSPNRIARSVGTHAQETAERDHVERVVTKRAQSTYLEALDAAPPPLTRERLPDTLSLPVTHAPKYSDDQSRLAITSAIGGLPSVVPASPQHAEPRSDSQHSPARTPVSNVATTPLEQTSTRAAVLPPNPTLFMVQPRRAEPRADAKAAPRSEAAKDAPPAVVVTIGRLEIRAVPASPMRKSASHAEPAMSLADYLRERSQGLR